MVGDDNESANKNGEMEPCRAPEVPIGSKQCSDRFRRRLATLKKVSVGQDIEVGVSFHFDRDVARNYYVMLTQNALNNVNGGARYGGARRESVIMRVSEIRSVIAHLNDVLELCGRHARSVRELTNDAYVTKQSQLIPEEWISLKPAETNLTSLTHDPVKQRMARIYAEIMLPLFPQQMIETCNGCRAMSSSFLDHALCMFSSVNEQVQATLNELFVRVDNEKANQRLFTWIKGQNLLPVNTKDSYLKKEELVRDAAWLNAVKDHLIDLVVEDSLRVGDNAASATAVPETPPTATTTAASTTAPSTMKRTKKKRKLSKNLTESV